MGMSSKVKTALILFTVATVVYSIGSKKSHGRFLGVPFEWRIPRLETVRRRLWDPSDGRLFTPTVYGIGWCPNIYQVLVRLGYARTQPHRGPDLADRDGDRFA